MTETVTAKRCTKCDTVKPVDEFGKHKRYADGCQVWCKECFRANYRENQAVRLTQQREYRGRNLERIREYDRARATTEERQLYRAEYRLVNRDVLLEKLHVWRQENPNYGREWYQNNRHAVVSKTARYRARKRALPAETVALRQLALRDGPHCWMCGSELSEWNPAHLDHLIPIAAPNRGLAPYGVTNPGTVPANIALACPACNRRKSDRILLCAIARYYRNLEMP